MRVPTNAAGMLFRSLPALVVVTVLPWIWPAVARASWATLGRDQGIFQYIAWAVGQGEVAYRDVRDVNGPVIILVHQLFQALGGTEEHRFRVLDLLFTSLSFLLAGACVPAIVASRAGRAAARLPWMAASWVLGMAQYVVYGFWDTAQRESFLDWFVLGSVALQAGARGSRRMLFVSGALSLVPIFGKPTYALFVVSQLVAIVLDRPRLRPLATFLAGGLAGLVVPVFFLLVRGDVVTWARITFVDVPSMYRFIWPRPPEVILGMTGYADLARVALLTSLVLGLLVVRHRLPRAALPIASMPALGLVSVVVQAKGFPYHFHPVTLGTTFGWVVVIAAAWEIASPVRFVALAGAGAAAVHAARLALAAPFPAVPSSTAMGYLESEERLGDYERVDFFPVELRAAAAYIREHTRPDERVQMYGMDAYVLFLARRRSATPYIYAYDLDVDAALYGSFDPGGPHPDAREAQRIRRMRDDHETDLRSRLERAPPAAFVFVDRSPLMTDPSAVADFAFHCPEVAGWVRPRYHETATFGVFHVWLRE